MPATSTELGPWLRRFHPAPAARTRLVCLPYAGGSASYYFPVSRALAPSVDVLAVQYPGRQDRRGEPCLEDLHELADLLAGQLRPLLEAEPDTGYALFGHSLGATLAFEVAVRLQEAGLSPSLLCASGRRAPSRTRNEHVHLLDDEALVADMKVLGGDGAQLLDDEELRELVLPYVRSDYKAAETYRYRSRPRLACPLLVLTGDDDPRVTAEEADAWREHTTGAFDLRVFPGGHFFLNSHVPAVLDELARRLGTRG
ncbi:thioesterase II family protein [Streptomyces sp. NBC_00986]|uniref:thioesterase II family protein n=1 Tax=Streptomyces sp. NBC_00986 TaxID=2903702 RepID=UPI00386EFF97|nr:alpha/beta fold hydrolase [Streptomyces sp. NBC_00986]WSX64525.1 alpha/beta fold hydrolase [Streptomyces sp. NBC_00986]